MSPKSPPLFAPEIGDKVLLNPAGKEEKFTAYFIGMEQGRYVVTSLGPFAREIERMSKVLPKGCKARLFNVRRGVMHGYMVQVLGYATTPYQHLYLSYPDRNETHNLRQFDRVDCHLPGQVGAGSGAVKGMVDNISQGGCRLQIAPEEVEKLGALDRDRSHILYFQLNTETEPCRVKCMVVKVDDAPGGYQQVGLRFDSMVGDAGSRLQSFIDFVIRFRS